MLLLINTVDLCFEERNLTAKSEISCIPTKHSRKPMHILLNFLRGVLMQLDIIHTDFQCFMQ